MKNFSKGLIMVALLLANGCAYNRRPEVVYASPAYPPPPSPVSERPAVRVYPTRPAEIAPIPPRVPGASDRDLAIAGGIRELLHGNTARSRADNVQASVLDGVVTLQGGVPSQNDRLDIVSRVSRIPGVVRVTDELRVELR